MVIDEHENNGNRNLCIADMKQRVVRIKGLSRDTKGTGRTCIRHY